MKKERTEYEVVLSDFAITNLLIQSLGAVIHISPKSKRGQLLSDLSRVLLLSRKVSPGNSNSDSGCASVVLT